PGTGHRRRRRHPGISRRHPGKPPLPRPLCLRRTSGHRRRLRRLQSAMGLELRPACRQTRPKGEPMIRIRELTLRPGESQSRLHALAAKALKLPPAEISYLEIHRRSLDARKKQDIRWIHTVDVAVRLEEKKLISKLKNQKITLAEPYSYDIPKPEVTPTHRPVVVGFGPGGMFAALVLAEAGLRPIVLERGYDAKTRHQMVEEFFKTGKLDPKCNV